MVRKKLSDMIQQEVKKSPDANAESVIEVKAEKVVEPKAEIEALPDDQSHQEDTLKATVADLQAALAQAKENEANLQQQISSLKSDLDQHKSLVDKVKQDLDKANSLKKELEETKQAALKLAEANSTLIAEMNAFKTGKEKPKAEMKALATVQEKPKAEMKALATVKENPKPENTQRRPYRELDRHFPKFVETKNAESSDFASNSWFD
ncbi:MAG: hypothetical protein WBB28_09165 [Crinalium sp.]